MAGIRNICKRHGGMIVRDVEGNETKYKWDDKKGEPVVVEETVAEKESVLLKDLCAESGLEYEQKDGEHFVRNPTNEMKVLHVDIK